MLVLALAMVQPVAAQSADAGVDAAKRGDFATALRILRPLAKQGGSWAQHSLGGNRW
jgi:DNA polymerase III delta subunit